MAKRTKELGLGRGLNALLGDPDLTAGGEGSVSLPISQVEPGLNQPRKRFEPEALADLAESIRIHGIIQPLTVRRLAYGVGVEKVFPLHSPSIEKIETVRTGFVRRAKLYYLRDRVGKAAKVKEKL